MYRQQPSATLPFATCATALSFEARDACRLAALQKAHIFHLL